MTHPRTVPAVMRGAFWLVLVVALAGCAGEESACQTFPTPAVAQLPFGDAAVTDATVREVLRERGWQVTDANGTWLGTFVLPDGTSVQAVPILEGNEGYPGIFFGAVNATRSSTVEAAQLLSPAVEPVVAGLSDREGRAFEVTYEAGVEHCGEV